MEKKVLFIRNGLEKFDQILKTLERISPFQVNIGSFLEFTNNGYFKFINTVKLSHLFLVIEESFFQENMEIFEDYFRDKFSFPFMNFILITGDPILSNHDAMQQEQKYYFHFSTDIDPNVQVMYFDLYANSLFNYSVTADRLTEYIASTFESIISEEQLRQKTEELQKLNDKLEEINKTDTLTHLFNRKTLFELLEQERKRAARDRWRVEGNIAPKMYGQEPLGEIVEHFGIFSVLMIDIDHFKHVNDTYGHLAGDRVLKYVGQILSKQGSLRTTDIAGRFGGEEFIVLLPGTNAQHALEPANRITEALKKKEFTSENDTPFHVTLSIGISEYCSQDDRNEDIISRADQALYYSKTHGRDQVTIFEDFMSE